MKGPSVFISKFPEILAKFEEEIVEITFANSSFKCILLSWRM